MLQSEVKSPRSGFDLVARELRVNRSRCCCQSQEMANGSKSFKNFFFAKRFLGSDLGFEGIKKKTEPRKFGSKRLRTKTKNASKYFRVCGGWRLEFFGRNGMCPNDVFDYLVKIRRVTCQWQIILVSQHNTFP